jgi:hypothetical protein
MPKLKLTLQQVKENYKRDVTQRTKDRIEALTSETINTDNTEETNFAEERVLACRILAAKIKTNQNKLDVLIYVVALLVAVVALLVAQLVMKNHE